jgi:hypothetical protein
MSPPISRRGARTASTSSSVTNLPSAGSTVGGAAADAIARAERVHVPARGGGVDQGACTRARRARGSASDARRARATTARTATAADIVGSLVDAVPKGMGFRRESAGASFLILS